MKRFLLDITLNEDCIFSMQNTTTGGHQTLTHIPGSALLGAVAARLYPHLSTNDTFAAFHSGSLRFGNGYPATRAGKIAWPVPLCWHRAKSQEGSPTHLKPEHIYNFLHVSELPNLQQPKQIREGYISEDGEWILPRSSFRLKTAIDPKTGCAAEAQLFGYSSLLAGQRFKAKLEADDDFPLELLNQVTEMLENDVLLGRSRSAEYGSTSIRVTAVDPPLQNQDKPAQAEQLTLWLLSDCFPCLPSGMPSTDITTESLGLPPGTRINWNRTFTRIRSFSPWNAHRQGYDCERFGIQAGSVLSISLPPDSDLSNITASLTQGIGLYREGGAGQVWVNPPLLRHEHPSFLSSTVRDTTSPPPPQRPNHPLLNWLTKSEATESQEVQEKAWGIAENYWVLIDGVCRDKGLPVSATDFYPSVSQWGTVLQVARTKSGNDLYQALFSDTKGIIKRTGKNWGLDIFVMDKSCNTLDEWIKKKVSQESSCNASLVQHLAHKLMDGHPNRGKSPMGELK